MKLPHVAKFALLYQLSKKSKPVFGISVPSHGGCSSYKVVISAAARGPFKGGGGGGFFGFNTDDLCTIGSDFEFEYRFSTGVSLVLESCWFWWSFISANFLFTRLLFLVTLFSWLSRPFWLNKSNWLFVNHEWTFGFSSGIWEENSELSSLDYTITIASCFSYQQV